MSPDAVRSLALAARTHAERLRLVLLQSRGPVGRAAGGGTGSSLDYQDHRPFQLGDDPRTLDWNAYARADQLIAKVYRAEIAPAIDVVFDASRSVAATESKLRRSLELLFFCVESGQASDARVQVWFAGAELLGPTSGRALLAAARLPAWAAVPSPRLDQIPWRGGALRIWISDLLFAGAPERWVTPLVGQGAAAVVLAPFDATESEPNWRGQQELEDVDTGQVRAVAATPALLSRYRAAYEQHFAGWQGSLSSRGARLVRVASHTSFLEAMEPAARLGVVEPRA